MINVNFVPERVLRSGFFCEYLELLAYYMLYWANQE